MGDMAMVGGEIIQVEAMPRGPDDDIQFLFVRRAAAGPAGYDARSACHRRAGIQSADISAGKAVRDAMACRWCICPIAMTMAVPGYGKDSRLRFTAPADGEYIVRLRDVRGLKGDDYAYRLTVRPPSPDFKLSVRPRNPNVPVGGRIPVTVTALRLDDFDGPIQVAIENLPAGLSATKGVIEPGQVNATLLLSADQNARLETAVPLQVSGKAQAGARQIAHWANPEDKLKLIALMPKPDIAMEAKTREVVLEPGKTATVEVAIQRNNNFGGRVPVEVYNLPPTVIVANVGLNGVLIHENDNHVTFTLQALPNAKPLTS